MPEVINEIAQQFARSLDSEDYEGARVLLAEDCTYNARIETITDRDAIISSYRERGDRARKLFDSVDYSNEIEAVDPERARITFVDKLRCKDRTHTYRCQQTVHIRPDGLIDRIKHEELADERERLLKFCRSCNLELS